MAKNKCCICGEEYEGFGNNAEPLKEGRCCDVCNNKVILERMRQLQISVIANMAASKVTNEIVKANAEKGEEGIKEVLKKYDLEDCFEKED